MYRSFRADADLLLGSSGWTFFTPTEAAAVPVTYALVIGVFVFRELTLKDMSGCSS
jgi:C4-dicarboxylate transporter DctM subunit